ncbi:MAG: sel1 repeat family protein [Lentisphaerae bacterium]|nr:sel1 repeat family protein [Lentisphaerota bacterium]
MVLTNSSGYAILSLIVVKNINLKWRYIMKFGSKLLLIAALFGCTFFCMADDDQFAYDRENNEFYEDAEAGDARAQYNLGVCYFTGKDVERYNLQEAVRWFRRAADQGYANAECFLGLCYTFGRGVTQNYVTARSWFEKAAAKDIAEAQYNLGWFHETGKAGFAADPVEALNWYRKAAAKEHARAKTAIERLSRRDNESNTPSYLQ